MTKVIDPANDALEIPTAADVSRVKSAVETGKPEDEPAEDEVTPDEEGDEGADEGAESGDGDGSEEEEEPGDEEDENPKKPKGDADPDDKPDDKTERTFNQFTGDGTDASYIGNLEEAYKKSSAEGIRLNTDLKTASRRVEIVMQAVARDPELATKLQAAMEGTAPAGSGDGKGEGAARPSAEDPILTNIRSEWERNNEKEAQDFIDANPEVISDPEIKSKVIKWMGVFSKEALEEEGRLMGAKEAMTAAYKHLGYDVKESKEKVARAMKEQGTPTKPTAAKKKKTSGSGLTDAQGFFADQMGVSREKVAKYATK